MDSWRCWIEKNIMSDGRIRDPFLKTSLPFQYHYTSYLLGSACLDGPAFPDEKARLVWNYYKRIPWDLQKVSIEFNAFLLSLTDIAFEAMGTECTLSKDILEYITTMPLSTLAGLGGHNRNFTAMSFFVNLWIKSKGLPSLDVESLRNNFFNSQSNDHFFHDSPCSNLPGIPSLVYHSKMSACALLAGVLLNDRECFDRGHKAVDAHLKLCPVERSMAWGRSQNSLFGFANYYLSLRLLAKSLDEKVYSESADNINLLVSRIAQPGGEHGINLANDNLKRPGYDLYMYPIVYNTYAWAIMRFADAIPIHPISSHAFADNSRDSRLLKIHGDGGFYNVKTRRYNLYGNIHEFAENRSYGGDARYAPLIPAVVFQNRRILIPSIPIRHPHVYFFGDERHAFLFRRRIVEMMSVLYDVRLDNHRHQAGFLPFGRGPFYLIVPSRMTMFKQTDCGFMAEFVLKRIIHHLPQRLGLLNSKDDSYGILSCEISFSESGLSISTTTHLEKVFHGKWYHLNARFADSSIQEVKSDSSESGCYINGDGISWKHSPRPEHLSIDRIPGSDGNIMYVRSKCLKDPPPILKTTTVVEFPQEEKV